MIYLIYEKKEMKKLVSILADNYIAMTYNIKDIDKELALNIIKEEVKLDDALIVYKENGKYIPVRYATVDYPLAYDSENPTKMIGAANEFIKNENANIDLYLNLMDYAVAYDLEEFNAQMEEMEERINKENNLVYLEDDKDMLDALDLDVTFENFEKVIDLINKKECFVYIKDDTEYKAGLEIHIKNLNNKEARVDVIKNDKNINTDIALPGELKVIKLPKLEIENDDILAIMLDFKIIYGK